MVFIFVFFWDSYNSNVGAFHIVLEVSEIVLIATGGCRCLRCFSAGGVTVGLVICGVYLFIYLFFLPVMLPSVLPRLTTDLAVRVFLVFGNFSLFKTPFPGQSSLPTSFVSFFAFYIFSYLFLKTMICFSGCLMSSASIQKLLCEMYSAFKCSFDEFVGEKVVSLSYSSAILGPPHVYLITTFI